MPGTCFHGARSARSSLLPSLLLGREGLGLRLGERLGDLLRGKGGQEDHGSWWLAIQKLMLGGLLGRSQVSLNEAGWRLVMVPHRHLLWVFSCRLVRPARLLIKRLRQRGCVANQQAAWAPSPHHPVPLLHCLCLQASTTACCAGLRRLRMRCPPAALLSRCAG